MLTRDMTLNILMKLIRIGNARMIEAVTTVSGNTTEE